MDPVHRQSELWNFRANDSPRSLSQTAFFVHLSHTAAGPMSLVETVPRVGSLRALTCHVDVLSYEQPPHRNFTSVLDPKDAQTGPHVGQGPLAIVSEKNVAHNRIHMTNDGANGTKSHLLILLRQRLSCSPHGIRLGQGSGRDDNSWVSNHRLELTAEGHEFSRTDAIKST